MIEKSESALISVYLKDIRRAGVYAIPAAVPVHATPPIRIEVYGVTPISPCAPWVSRARRARRELRHDARLRLAAAKDAGPFNWRPPSGTTRAHLHARLDRPSHSALAL